MIRRSVIEPAVSERERSVTRAASRMTIGEVARKTGVSIRTLRFYDRLAILNVHGRGANNYRLFGADVVGCVRCIRHMQDGGLTLRQIQRIVQVERSGGDARAALREAYEETRSRLDSQIARLEAQRETALRRIGGAT